MNNGGIKNRSQAISSYCSVIDDLCEQAKASKKLYHKKADCLKNIFGINEGTYRRLRAGHFDLTRIAHIKFVTGINTVIKTLGEELQKSETLKKMLKPNSATEIDECMLLAEHSECLALRWVESSRSYVQEIRRIRANDRKPNIFSELVLTVLGNGAFPKEDILNVTFSQIITPNSNTQQEPRWSVEIKLTKDISKFNLEDLDKKTKVLQASIAEYGTVICRSMEPGCTKLTIELSKSDALRLMALLRDDGIPVKEQPAIYLEEETHSQLRTQTKPTLTIRKNVSPSETDIYAFMAANASPVEPNSIKSALNECLSLLWHVLRTPKHGLTTSLARFHFVPTLLASQWHDLNEINRRATRRALMYAFVYWPMLTVFVTMLVTLPLGEHLSSYPFVWAAVTAIGLGLAGSMVCSPLFHSLGVAAGTICFGFFYACSEAMIFRWVDGKNGLDGLHNLASFARQADPFIAVVGDVIGTAAPELHGYSFLRILLVLVPPSAAIIASAWLMGNPRSDQPAQIQSLGRTIGFGLLGSVCGAGIGLVMLTYNFLSKILALNASFAFWLAAIVVNSSAYYLCVFIRTGNSKKAVKWAFLYGVIGALVWGSVLVTKGTVTGLYIGGLGTAYFHSCWFSLCYVTAFAKAGRNAAFLAASLEGVAGFVIFNLILIY